MPAARTEFSQALKAIAQERGLDPNVILETIKEAIIAAYKRDAREQGTEVDSFAYDAVIDSVNGETKVFAWPLPAEDASEKEIEKGVEELLTWLKEHKTITDVALFHTALYALHPFNNGNKRVCRVLEHPFFRNLGINQKNLYSTSYYYHKQKERYYKYLLYSLERKNLNHFVSFIQEALVLSMIDVVKLSLEAKRNEFLERQDTDNQIKSILKPLIKRSELQFKNLFKHSKGKIARQTFVNYLQKATDEAIVTKREEGRTTYYGFNLKTPQQEEGTLKEWLKFAKQRLSFIPDEIKLI